MAHATVEDVRERFTRALTVDEERLAATLLGDAEALLRRRVRDLDGRASADQDYRRLVVMVEAESVLRVLRNPEGYRSESDGDYSYIRSAVVASGRLNILDEEWALLGVRRGAYTVAPVIGTPRCGPPHRHTPGRPW